MNTTTFEITCSYMNEDFTLTLDSSTCTESDVLEQLKEEKTTRFEDESGEDLNTDLEDEFEVTDWADVPEWAQDWEILEELLPVLHNSSYDLDIFEAANELDIPFSDVDEAYSGTFRSDEDFAEQTAEQLGLIDNNAAWPANCIDWEQAARELMYDYSEANGHYFCNL